MKSGTQHPEYISRMKKLPPLAADQAEGLVEPAFRIAETRKVGECIGREKRRGFGFRAEVHESQLRALGFDGSFDFRQRGDRLAAERSTKVAEEYEKYRTLGGKRRNRLLVLRKVCAEEIFVHF